ncbi:hypothetical protein [Alkalimarinus sediminis]|uniref:Uncharacterized protein n=1 Tax=Alkalimarinus sediminis TaxID=1632866 RepID=A0A9E8HHY6_9ALTE|nr:hypothetical protein [Alkalimarinus sediminis]UZW74522.1 hypothetical protein NNL22_16085 [Alkalimarinus sediminis]
MQFRMRLNKPISLLLALLWALFFCRLAYAQQTPEQKLIGAWEVFKDDDRPGEKVPEEVMNFWPEGQFTISKKAPAVTTHEGLFRINGSTLQLLVKKNSQGFVVKRIYALSENELRFKNPKNGWVYYKRISDQPFGVVPEL